MPTDLIVVGVRITDALVPDNRGDDAQQDAAVSDIDAFVRRYARLY